MAHLAPSNVLSFPVRARAPSSVGQVVGVVGEGRIRDPQTGVWKPVRAGQTLRRGAELITGLGTHLAVALATGDLLRMDPVSCCVLVDLEVSPEERRIRIDGRFGGLTLMPAGDKERAFVIDPMPAGAAPIVRDGSGTSWRLTERGLDVVLRGDEVEVRAVTRYKFPRP
jgi:hypothetical protein